MSAVDDNLARRLDRLAGKTIVAKLGGSTLGSHDTTLDDAVALHRAGARLVLVHGGGAAISAWLERTGKEPRFVGGLRVTDASTLEIVVMVLAGKVNKELVGKLYARGARAVGVSGMDGATLRGQIRDEALGYVGEVIGVNVTLVETLLSAGYLPVIAPIGMTDAGQALNVNADTAAAELAVALRASSMVFLSDVPGVLGASNDLMPRLTRGDVDRLKAEGVITRGMIPKAEACLRALAGVTQAQIVDGRQPHALLAELVEPGALGTTIVSD